MQRQVGERGEWVPLEEQLRTVFFLDVESFSEIELRRLGRQCDQIIESDLMMAAAVESEEALDYPDQATEGDFEAGLLAHLAQQRRAGQLAEIDAPSRQEPDVVRLQKDVLAMDCDSGDAEIKLPVVALKGDHSTAIIRIGIVRINVVALEFVRTTQPKHPDTRKQQADTGREIERA